MKKKLFFKFFVFAVIGALVTMTSCKDYDDDITRIDTGLNGVKSDLTSQLAAIKTEMNSSVDSKVKTVADGLAAEKAELDKLKAELATLKASAAGDTEIAALEKKIADTKTEIMETVITLEAFNNFKASNATQLDTLTLRVIALEENSATKAEMEALEAEIAGKLVALQGQLDALDVRVVALEKSLADLMAKHDEDVEDLIGKIGALRSELDPRITTIETLLEIADGKSGALDKITDELAAQLEKINANAEAIELLRTDLEAELAEQLALIKANEEAINGVAEDLAAKYAELVAADEDLQKQITDNYNELNGKITVNKEAIDALDLRVKGIEDKLPVIEKSIVDLGTELNLRIDSVFKLVSNRLTAITLAPNAYLEGIEAVKFTSLKYSPMEDGENTGVPTNYNMSIGAPALASYKFNPRTFNLSNADYNYVDRTAEIIMTTRAAGTSNLVEILSAPVYKPADGTVNFTLRRLNAHSTQLTDNDNKENFIGLEATLKGAALAEGETGVVVAAPQELVYDELITPFDLFISDKATLATAGNGAHYPVTFDDAKAGEVWYSDMTYDKIYNLKEKVATCLNDGNKHNDFVLEDYNLSYKFSVASSAYNITTGSTETNQQEWIELVDENEGTFKAEDFNKEAIGRTPIMKVELVDQDGNVVRRAFVKVEITAKKTDDIFVGKSAYDLVLACEGTAEYELNEMFIRENVYRIITNTQGQTSLSHEEFWNLYDATTAVTEVTKNNVVLQGISQPKIVDGDTGVGTATKKIVWAFDHSKVGSVGAAGSKLVATLTVKNKLASSEYPEHVTFRFVVNVTNPTFELDKVENAVYWKNNMYQVNIAVPNSPQSPASAAVFSTDLTQAYSTYDVEFTPDVEECVESEFVVVKTFANGEETMVGNVSTPLPGVGISGNNITLAKNGPNAAAVKTALNSEGGLQAVVQHVYTFNGDEVVVNEFMVNFIRPVTLNTQAPVSVTDAIDNGDVADFQWAGLLTDWRGNAIVAPEWEPTQACFGWWRFDHIMEYEYVPGYQRVKTPASVNVTYGTVSFTTGGPTTMYQGTAEWRIERRSGIFDNWATYPGGNTGTLETGVSMLTVSDVLLFLETLEAGINVPSNTLQYQYRLVVEVPVITSVTVPGGQLVEYTYVQSIDYIPAVYEDVPGEWIPKEYEPTDRPNVDGTADGERNGDWVWNELCFPWFDYTPGQYWNFYGPIGQLTADFNNVTTSLTYNGGELPVNVTLTQVGNTVKYVNVGTPISESYEIYIPATITYGWGTLETVLTIVVVPAV